MAISTEERRIVTVLFADVAGSTALGEELDPQEVRRLIHPLVVTLDCSLSDVMEAVVGSGRPRWTRTSYLRVNWR